LLVTLAFSQNQIPEVDGLVVLCPPDVYTDASTPLDGPLTDYDTAVDGHLGQLIRDRKFKGKKGQLVALHTLGKLPFGRLVLLGTGKASGPDHWLGLGERIGDAANKGRWQTLAVLPLTPDPVVEHLEPLARSIFLACYRFDRYKAKNEDDPDPVTLTDLLWIGLEETSHTARVQRRLDPLVRAIFLARDLVNEPAGAMTPTALAEAAESLGGEHLACEILDEDACAELGMELLLAVGRGSVEPPKLIHLTYTPPDLDPSLPKVALVGKGITFDSGGLSLKPSASMKDMKCDMAGGAAVLGAMGLLATYDVRCEVHGIVPACENMPGGNAYRLGDVIQSKHGPSVEVTNTDAEGRLALADGISYARSLGCERIVDLATLTGACLVALGPDVAGVLGAPDRMCHEILAAAQKAGEPMWQLPLVDGLSDQLKSQVADCKNAGGRYGGTISAALFLKKFVVDTDWVHLDIAGPAWADKPRPGRPAGGTGFGVATVVHWLASLEGEA
jgi:leucyl aminopeptidase